MSDPIRETARKIMGHLAPQPDETSDGGSTPEPGGLSKISLRHIIAVLLAIIAVVLLVVVVRLSGTQRPQQTASADPSVAPAAHMPQPASGPAPPAGAVVLPREVQFFNPTTGAPSAWYSRGADGSINLFDAPGFDPGSGQRLTPITSEVVAQVRAQAAAHEKDKKLRELVAIFDPGSYAPDVVLLGGASAAQDALSEQAVVLVLEQSASAVRSRGLTTDRIRPAVYDAGYFDRLFDGDTAALSAVGLAGKMRSALLVRVGAACRPADGVADVTSCTIAASARVLSLRSGISVLREYSVTGAGSTRDQALARAAELMQTQHPDLLNGL